MSRAIKFRAWNEFGKCWITFGCSRYCFNDGVLDIVGDSDLIYEQYTGLKDKNGKEIYEGDIVNIQGIRYYVDFAYGGFWFNNDNRRWKANRPFTHFQEINDTEVIGNIHENPELLELK